MDRLTTSQSALTLIDRGECFRAFLLLIARDRKIDERERSALLTIGRVLDFAKDFCENAINEVMENEYINNTPPSFSSRGVAEYFLTDAITLALTDDHLHPEEMAWLEGIAKANGVSPEWLRLALERGTPLRSWDDLDRTLKLPMLLTKT